MCRPQLATSCPLRHTECADYYKRRAGVPVLHNETRALLRAMTAWKLITDTPAPPPRPQHGHKGTFGSVLIVAGSRGMSGAASLAGRAALHGGAGLVTVAVPHCIQETVAATHPSYMTVGLNHDGDGRVCSPAFEAIESHLSRQTTVAVGPGLGQSQQVSDFVQQLYRDARQPLVLDADGLNAFVDDADKLGNRVDDAARVLTPHPGEFARLIQCSTRELESDRQRLAAEFAKQHGVVLLLKGHQTIITDGQRLAVNSTGDTGLATGGSGDVLTGLIASLLAQKMEPFSAAQLGAHLHGLAGELASEKYTDRYTTSLEILEQLSNAWRKIV